MPQILKGTYKYAKIIKQYAYNNHDFVENFVENLVEHFVENFVEHFVEYMFGISLNDCDTFCRNVILQLRSYWRELDAHSQTPTLKIDFFYFQNRDQNKKGARTPFRKRDPSKFPCIRKKTYQWPWSHQQMIFNVSRPGFAESWCTVRHLRKKLLKHVACLVLQN